MKKKYLILISITIIIISVILIIGFNVNKKISLNESNINLSSNTLNKINGIGNKLQSNYKKIEELKIEKGLEKQKKEIEKKKQEELKKNTNAKKVYLTFDDGPSNNTNLILQKLKKYNIKATFFVINKDNADYQKYYKEIVDQGHEIAIHSYTHNYKQIYKNVDAFFEDYNLLKEKIKNLTGKDVTTFRFPGGSSNSIVDKQTLQNIFKKALSMNAIYLDWNVDSEDSSGKKLNSQQIANNIINRVQHSKNAVILLHDTNDKYSTVEALDVIIPKLKQLGYTFDTVENIVDPSPFQHRKLQ